MAGPLNESVDWFIKQVQENENLTVEDREMFYVLAIKTLLGGINDGTQRWGLSMVMSRLAREAQKSKPHSL